MKRRTHIKLELTITWRNLRNERKTSIITISIHIFYDIIYKEIHRIIIMPQNTYLMLSNQNSKFIHEV